MILFFKTLFFSDNYRVNNFYFAFSFLPMFQTENWCIFQPIISAFFCYLTFKTLLNLYFFDFKLYHVGGRNKNLLKQVFSFSFKKVGFLYLKFFISRQILLGNVISFAFYIWNIICEWQQCRNFFGTFLSNVNFNSWRDQLSVGVLFSGRTKSYWLTAILRYVFKKQYSYNFDGTANPFVLFFFASTSPRSFALCKS